MNILEESWQVTPAEDPVHINWENFSNSTFRNLIVTFFLVIFHCGLLILFGYIYSLISEQFLWKNID